MDVGLHGSMDGIEAAGEIKDRFGIPVIFITGYPDEDVRQRAGVTEPYEYLIKPIQRSDLQNSIELTLKKCRQTGPC